MILKTDWIKDFKSRLGESEVGGKFHKQAIMAQEGLPVPPFFCLTTEVFREISAGILTEIHTIIKATDWNSDKAIHESSQKIHARISEVRFPEPFARAVFEEYDRIFSGVDLVSVRSSMVAKQAEFSEDSKHHAFAGMSESFLYVKRDSILERIKDCFASGYSPQVLTYRHAQGIDLLDFSISVGVQKMVFGTRSFVLFTCDPNTLERNTLVVAGHGIGEGVVQEKVETDHYFVLRKNRQVTKKVVKKERMLTFNATSGEGLCEAPVPTELADRSVLTDEELLTLDLLGQKVEKVFGAPQDIEGCFDEHHQLYLLQSRPIQFSEENVTVWTSANVSESFPGTTTPLTFSFAQDFYRIIFSDCYRALGVPEKVIAQNFDHLDHMVGYLRGKIYYNLTSFYRLHSLSPLFPLFKKQWEDMMGFTGSFFIDAGTGSFTKFMRGARTVIFAAWGLLLISWRYVTNQRDVDRFLAWWEETIRDLRGKDFARLSAFECMVIYREVWRKVGVNWWITLLNDTHLPTAYSVTEFLFKKWKLDEDPGLMSNLLCGGEDFKSVEIMYNGIRLSELVKSDPDLLARFRSSPADELLLLIQAEEKYRWFKDKFDYHLHFFGDRGLQELKIEQPSLRDNPVQLVQVIKNYISQDMGLEAILADEQRRRAEGEATLARKLRWSPGKRLFLKFQFHRLRGFIQNRENTRYCRSELFGLSKRLFSAIARNFVDQNLLEEAGDIHFLHVDEIFGVIEGAAVTGDLRQLVTTRRREFAENEKFDPPMNITTNGALYLNALERHLEAEDGELRGLGSSPGVVRGRARVILDPKSIDRMEEGDILIAKETDPGWLFLMLASKGMVVERGSMLSHTAITGRKFGIPTIVSVPGITEKLKTGDQIEIDGSRGTIKVLDPA